MRLLRHNVIGEDTRAESIIESLGGQRAEANPIRLVAVGVGIENCNDDLLEQVSNDGDGWYRYMYSPEEAQGLLVADEARAQVSWDAETVETWRLIGYLNRAAANESFEDDEEDFAELHVGQENTVVYRQNARPGALGTLALRWHHPGSGETQTQEWTLASANPVPWRMLRRSAALHCWWCWRARTRPSVWTTRRDGARQLKRSLRCWAV